MVLISSNSNYLRCLILILLSISLLSIIPKSTSTSSNDYYFCSKNTTIFNPNSKYQQNLHTVFQSLSSKANDSEGFHITVSGNNTKDAVYGLFLCRGDLNTSSCKDCVTTATTTGLPRACPNGKQAVIWYDECMVRYSDEPLDGEMDISPAYILWSTNNQTANQPGFLEIRGKAIDDVVNRTANDMSKFATSQVSINSSESLSLYTMGQCTPDLTAFDCTKCLIAASFALQLSDGGRVLRPSCNLRYETQPFFALSSTPPAPAPAQPPEGANPSGRTTNPMASSPGPSSSGKTTLSPQLNTIVGFGFFVIVNLYYYFI